MKTQDFRSLPPAGQEQLRRKAVEAVLGGMMHVEAARMFGVTRQAVGAWMERYDLAGAAALKARRRGRPRGTGRLLPWQAAQTARAVVETGKPAGPLTDGAPHTAVLASVFCIPQTGNIAIDISADIPGPGSIGLNGSVQLLP